MAEMRPIGAGVIGVAAAALAVVSSPAAGEQVDPFSALVDGKREIRRAEPTVERFTVAADGRVFLLEGDIGAARIKFLCTDDDPRLACRLDPKGPAEEIYLVSGARGPRGDVIYKNSEGEMLLRMTSYGGATVFWPGEHQGQAASRSFGDDKQLALPPVDGAAAARRGRAATAYLSAATGAPIVFDVGETSPPASGKAPEDPAADSKVLSDAVVRVAVGMQGVASDPTGARILGARVNAVEFRRGAAPALSLDGHRLIVVYNPDGDVGGRPSSRAVTRFLENSL